MTVLDWIDWFVVALVAAEILVAGASRVEPEVVGAAIFAAFSFAARRS